MKVIKWNFIKSTIEEFKSDLDQVMASHKDELHCVHEEFRSQCRDYLSDHMVHRREIFTNQKAQFQLNLDATKQEFKDIKAEMDQYI